MAASASWRRLCAEVGFGSQAYDFGLSNSLGVCSLFSWFPSASFHLALQPSDRRFSLPWRPMRWLLGSQARTWEHRTRQTWLCRLMKRCGGRQARKWSAGLPLSLFTATTTAEKVAVPRPAQSRGRNRACYLRKSRFWLEEVAERRKVSSRFRFTSFRVCSDSIWKHANSPQCSPNSGRKCPSRRLARGEVCRRVPLLPHTHRLDEPKDAHVLFLGRGVEKLGFEHLVTALSCDRLCLPRARKRLQKCELATKLKQDDAGLIRGDARRPRRRKRESGPPRGGGRPASAFDFRRGGHVLPGANPLDVHATRRREVQRTLPEVTRVETIYPEVPALHSYAFL